MTIDDISKALNEAEQALHLADKMTDRMLDLVVGRLRKSQRPYLLSRLKRELREFNAHTKSWNDVWCKLSCGKTA